MRDLLIGFVLLFSTGISYAQEKPVEKYNEALRITEYYNEDGEMIGFSRINKQRKTVDHYNMAGSIVRRERIESDSILTSLEKRAFPKSQLSDVELKRIVQNNVEEKDGRMVLREEDPDLECIGYYDFDGKLVGYNKYNRGTETWNLYWLKSDSKK